MKTHLSLRIAGLLLLSIAGSARAVRITEIPTNVAAPWGVGFNRYYARFAAGGASSWTFFVDEGAEVQWQSLSATDLRAMAVSGNGDVWIAETSANKIWRLSLPTSVTSFSAPGGPTGITLGPDGNIWFTEATGNKIGRLTPSGTLWESAALPTANSHPIGITASTDGNIWFVEQNTGNLGRMTPAGALTEFPLPNAAALPYGIASSGYGILAVTEPGLDKIALVNTNEPAVEFIHEQSIPTGLSVAQDITFAQDGFFYFLEYATSKVGRVYVNDFVPIKEYLIPTGSCHPRQLVAGPNGDLWFAEQATGKLGRIELHPSGDANGDGNVDVADVFYLINFLFAGGPAPQ